MSNKIIAQGAEAKISLKDNWIIKDRISKSYRIKELDNKIRKQRTRSEAKLLEKASKIINAPKPFFQPDFYQIKMPFIEGEKISEILDSFPLKKQKEICRKIGEEISKLHNADIIHGDLTTSNMILVEKKSNNKKIPLEEGESLHEHHFLHASVGSSCGKDNSNNFKIFFIDFGLGFISSKAEDKAVDLHLLKQALEAKHFKNWEVLFDEIKKGYSNYKDSEKVLERLKVVEKRGRYKAE